MARPTLTVEAIATHESGGCPEPETCSCEGQWPYFPKYGMIYDRVIGDVRETWESDLAFKDKDYKTGGFVDAGNAPKNRIDRINQEEGHFPPYWDETKKKAWRSSMGDKPFHRHVDTESRDINHTVKFPGELHTSGEGITASKPVVEHVTVPMPHECEVVAEDDVVEVTLRYKSKEDRHAAMHSAADILNEMGISTTI